MFKMNPKQMEQMMRKMGINSQDLVAKRVTIELEDRKLIFDNPKVSRVNMMGQDTFQIIGESKVESLNQLEITEDDVNTIVEQTNCSKEQAKEALEKNKGDIAKTILELSE